MPNVTQLFDKGAETFFNKGTNGRWKGVFRPDDLALYDAKVAQAFFAWLRGLACKGRIAAGEPNTLDLERLWRCGVPHGRAACRAR